MNDERKSNGVIKDTIPLISIVCVVKNNAVGLEKTLHSIYSQNCEKEIFEVVVVDAASTDSTEDVIIQYTPDVYVSEQDTGIYDAMNKGILHSKGKWIYFLNGGDIFFNNTILSVFVSCNVCHQKNMHHSIICAPIIESYKGSAIVRNTVSEKKMPFAMPAGHQGIFMKREVIKRYMFDTSYKICGDADLFARLLHDGHTICFFDTLVAIIDGVGASNVHWKQALRERHRIQKTYYISSLYTVKMMWYIVQVYSRKILRSFMPEKMYMYFRNSMFRNKKKSV